MKKYNVAVAGATGAVGEAMFDILQEREFPINNIYALASERSEGKKVMLGSKAITVLIWQISILSLRILLCSQPEERFLQNLHQRQVILVVWLSITPHTSDMMMIFH